MSITTLHRDESISAAATSRVAATAAERRRAILQPGRNCWAIAPASRASVLIDGENYFHALYQALRKARRSILIVGWDFDGRVRLCPGDGDCPAIGPLLRDLVEKNPELEVHILIWSVAVIHASSAPEELIVTQEWQKHPRIHLCLDSEHPIYAAHHQKIVCIDEQLAFSGGMDLTVERWDSCSHRNHDPLRVIEPGGQPYEAVHDVQILVEGEAAARLGEVIRERWQRFNGRPPKAATVDHDVWPDDLPPDFTDAEVGIARTLPRWATFPEVKEVDALTVDAILAAHTLIYIENQYLTSPRVAKLLAKRLSQPKGPDVLIVVSQKYYGGLERFIMGRNRQRVIRRLRRADRYGRLHVLCPVLQDGDEQCAIKVHSKLMIVDDIFLRVGSANLNNRSMGLDTECDVAIEGREPRIQKQIERLRERLLAEHVGATADEVRESLISHRSMLSGLDALNNGERRLLDLMHLGRFGPIRPVFLTFLMDPIRPLMPYWLSRLRRGIDRQLHRLGRRARRALSLKG